MYVTTKNAGNNFYQLIIYLSLNLLDLLKCFLFSNQLFPYLFPSPVLLSRIIPLWLLISEFDRHEILLYEEVAKVPPFKRKTLILIGAHGVGRRRLKTKLLLRDPLLFGTTIPCKKSDMEY